MIYCFAVYLHMNVKGTKYTRRKVNMCAKTWGIAKFLNSCEGGSDLFNELYVTVFSRNPPTPCIIKLDKESLLLLNEVLTKGVCIQNGRQVALGVDSSLWPFSWWYFPADLYFSDCYCSFG